MDIPNSRGFEINEKALTVSIQNNKDTLKNVERLFRYNDDLYDNNGFLKS